MGRFHQFLARAARSLFIFAHRLLEQLYYFFGFLVKQQPYIAHAAATVRKPVLGQ